MCNSMLIDSSFTITDPLSMSRHKKVEEYAGQIVLPYKFRALAKVKFVFELLTAVV